MQFTDLYPVDIEETWVADEVKPIFVSASVRGVITRDEWDDYMYMYSTNQRHYLKHRDTRRYISFTR